MATHINTSEEILDKICALFPVAFYCDLSFAFEKLSCKRTKPDTLPPALTWERFSEVVDQAARLNKLEKCLVLSNEKEKIYQWRRSGTLSPTPKIHNRLNSFKPPARKTKRYAVWQSFETDRFVPLLKAYQKYLAAESAPYAQLTFYTIAVELTQQGALERKTGIRADLYKRLVPTS